MATDLDLRPSIAALPASPITQIADYGRGRPGLIPLWFGEGDLTTPEPITEAGVRALRDGRVFYTWQRGLPALREALAAYLERVHGVPVGVDRITVTSSGMTAIMMAVQALVGPGDEVVIVSPVWPNITAAVRVVGGVPRPVAMTLADKGWTLDLDAVFAACGPRTRAIFINSPGNPTGWVMEKPEMERVAAFARDRGLWVISDEVYARLVYDRRAAPSFLEVTGPEDRLLVVNSFSKNWSMTGWRLGWMVAPAELGTTLENLVQFSTSGAPEFIQHAGLAAVEEGEPYIRDLVDRCRQARDLVCDTLARLPRIRVRPPAGAFYAFFEVDGVTNSMALAKRIVDEVAVGLAPGCAFGEGGDSALRLCFAGSRERIGDAMDRLSRALA